MELKLSKPYPKQEEFIKARERFVAYGGARGGGKSQALRLNLVIKALEYPGIQILLMRRTLPQIRENHLIPLVKMTKGVACYKEMTKEFVFVNGSRIKLGYCDGERDVMQYQGQAYEIIALDEATQFSEFQFQALTESNRPSGLCDGVTSQMYLTCNPGGPGHGWVKRLFIDRIYKGNEKEEDYRFIQSLIYDNPYLLNHDPEYVRMLENLPEERKKAMLYGDWDVFEGRYFPEFSREVHVCDGFVIPKEWRRYRAIDYGLDMLACVYAAVDYLGFVYIYKEVYKPNLIISDAAKAVIEATGVGEVPVCTFAPPDLWTRRQDSGKSAAQIFAENGVILTKASNDRVHGWWGVKEYFMKAKNEAGEYVPRMKIFSCCRNLIRSLMQITFDEKNPDDCATVPHEITHAPDALRYFVAGNPARSVVSGEYDDGVVREMKEFLNY